MTEKQYPKFPDGYTLHEASLVTNSQWFSPDDVRALIDADRAQRVPAGLRDLVNALLHQIDIGGFMDSNGHDARMLKPVHDLMRMLSLPQPPVQPEPQWQELSDAEKVQLWNFQSDAPLSYADAISAALKLKNNTAAPLSEQRLKLERKCHD